MNADEQHMSGAGQVSDLPLVPGPSNRGSETHPTRSRLWLWFVAAFVLQALVWTAWFVIAAHHPVEEVPLAPSQNR